RTAGPQHVSRTDSPPEEPSPPAPPVLAPPPPRLHAARAPITPTPVAAVSRVLRLIVLRTVGPLASPASLGPARGPPVGPGSRAGPYPVTGFAALHSPATRH